MLHSYYIHTHVCMYVYVCNCMHVLPLARSCYVSMATYTISNSPCACNVIFSEKQIFSGLGKLIIKQIRKINYYVISKQSLGKKITRQTKFRRGHYILFGFTIPAFTTRWSSSRCFWRAPPSPMQAPTRVPRHSERCSCIAIHARALCVFDLLFFMAARSICEGGNNS